MGFYPILRHFKAIAVVTAILAAPRRIIMRVCAAIGSFFQDLAIPYGDHVACTLHDPHDGQPLVEVGVPLCYLQCAGMCSHPFRCLTQAAACIMQPTGNDVLHKEKLRAATLPKRWAQGGHALSQINAHGAFQAPQNPWLALRGQCSRCAA